MTSAFKGGWVFQIQDTSVSPIVYRTITEAISISGLGLTNPLVDATSFDSTAKEYIAGLPDGSEITIECNYVISDTAQELLRTAIINQQNKSFQVTVTDSSTSPNDTETFAFTGTCLSYTYNPSFDDKNTVSYTIKISGSITIT